jgi:2-methylcitrate dehydratase PrpD
VSDATLTGVQAIVEAEMTDGKTIGTRCDNPRGSAENPLTRAQLEAKLRSYGKARLSASALNEVIAGITNLEDLKSVRTLMDALRSA